MRFPKFGRAKNRSAAVAPTISFEPMIMSFHQITYEVRKYHQFKDTFCICAFAFSVNLLEGSNNRFIAIANKWELHPCTLFSYIIFCDFQVKIPGIKDPRVLLSNVSGFAKPNTMTALMGSSGAGKTTLLDVLAGRKTTGRISGDILINGYPKVQETFARISGWVCFMIAPNSCSSIDNKSEGS